MKSLSVDGCVSDEWVESLGTSWMMPKDESALLERLSTRRI